MASQISQSRPEYRGLPLNYVTVVNLLQTQSDHIPCSLKWQLKQAESLIKTIWILATDQWSNIHC